jgi:hypothetical protein
MGDVNGDGFSDVIVGVPYANTANIDNGEVHVFYGGSTFDNTVDVIIQNLDEPDGLFGFTVETGDLNNDSYDDLIVGAFSVDGVINENGEVRIFYGSSAGIDATADALLINTPPEDAARFGRWVSSGDVNGDGYDDVTVGSPFADTGAVDNGKVDVFFGGPGIIDTVSDAVLTKTPAEANAVFGRRITTNCDVNNDGFADIATSGFEADNLRVNNGEVQVFFGGPGAFNTTPDKILTKVPGQVGANIGVGIACGDVNNDGYDEIITGAFTADTGAFNNGEVHIFFGGTGSFYGDSDGDGIVNNVDNCPTISNADQLDTDLDGIGDLCDDTLNGDSDGDGIDNLVDNCPTISNADQLDTDLDGIGDLCDDTPYGSNQIIIIEDTIPDGSQNFVYTASGLAPTNFTLDDDADATISNIRKYTDVLPGNYTVTQNAPPGFVLTNLICTDPDNGTIVNLGTRAVTIDFDTNESIICTYTNSQRGTITIIEDTIPDGPQNFVYTASGLAPTNFTLDDDTDITLANTRIYTNTSPGTYTVTQNAPPGFVLTNLICTDPDNGTTVNLGTRAATIDLDGGESITCTFTNGQPGTITIIDDTIPDGPQNIAFVTSGGLTPTNFVLDDDADAILSNTRVYNNVLPGTYTITQNIPPAGFSLTNLVCTDPDNGTTVNLTGRETTIDLDGGESITCTFTNGQPGTITIIDDTIPDGPQNIAFTATGLTPANFVLDDDADATLSNTRTYNNVLPGSYTVTQNSLASFTLTNLVCTDPDNGTTVNLGTREAIIDVDANESITCTFTNTAN